MMASEKAWPESFNPGILFSSGKGFKSEIYKLVKVFHLIYLASVT